MRGVGVHHAGVLPKYRRIVEELFQRKLLLGRGLHRDAGGGDQPAGPVGRAADADEGPAGQEEADRRRARPIRSSAAPAGRSSTRRVSSSPWPTRTTSRSLRWKEKYDQIPEDTKDPGLMKAKKGLKKKMPHAAERPSSTGTRSSSTSCCAAAAGAAGQPRAAAVAAAGLHARASPEVEPIRDLVGRRLMDPKQLEAGPEGTRPDADDAAPGRLRRAWSRSRRRTGRRRQASQPQRGTAGRRLANGLAAVGSCRPSMLAVSGTRPGTGGATRHTPEHRSSPPGRRPIEPVLAHADGGVGQAARCFAA